VFALVAAVLGVGTRREWRAEPRISGPLFSPVRHLAILRLPRARAVLVSVFLEMIFFYGAFSLLGAMLKDRFDLPYTVIGLLLAGFGLGGLAYTTVVRWMLARLGQRGCMIAGGSLSAACYLAILATPWWPVVGLCTIGLGFAFYTMHNTLQTKATEMAPQSRATGMSLFSMAWAAGQAVGAGLMGAGVAAFGYAPMIAGFALAYAALGAGLRARLDRL
jgi:predicted MFS family arabinose efflux permease